MTPEQAAALRKPFPPESIGSLPKGGASLAYVGHAAVTDRLLQVDPAWTWEPVAFDANGLPALDDLGGIWIRLTVCGVTRYGYGHPDNAKGADGRKAAISDALRNAAMRFGVALDLWAKEDLQGGVEYASAEQVAAVLDSLDAARTREEYASVVERARRLHFTDEQIARIRAAVSATQQRLADESEQQS